MTIKTRSLFYYGQTIDETNFSLDFSEGGGELQATLSIGEYSLETFAVEIARAMNIVAGQVYTVTVDRTTRKITISAPGNFELLVSSGSRSGTHVFSLIGFTGADRTGADNYEGNNGSGSEYRPQMVLTNYLDPGLNEEDVSANVNESGSGAVIEVFSFGSRSFTEFNIQYITDKVQGVNSIVDQNLSGVDDAVAFMQYSRTKAVMEFMPDLNDTSTFHNIILEKTKSSSKGVGFRLNKMFKPGVEDYYETGMILFRKTE